MGKQLPVIQSDSYRSYPTASKKTRRISDERRVCNECLSGACCQSEGPIAITSLDVLRLATFLDISSRALLQMFTQDRFCDEYDELRRTLIDEPSSSVVTFLRRRAHHATSPCIFLQYIRESDGTPRRVCSVYPARPLACREY